MNFKFTYNPDEALKEKMLLFFNLQNSVAIEQHPSWMQLIDPPKKICYFVATDQDQVKCMAIIEEYKSKLNSNANIQFGPIFTDSSVGVLSIKEIHNYYKKAGFTLLTVQPGYADANLHSQVEIQVNKILKVKYFFDRNNWTSIAVNTTKSEGEILRSMSKGHKSDIKKAEKQGIQVVDTFTTEQFEEFKAIYINMHKERKLPEPSVGFSFFLNTLKSEFDKNSIGRFLLVKSVDDTILGGIIVLYQGETVRYFKGAADPGVRHLPVLHLAIWRAIKDTLKQGLKQFDMWGYNHYAKENEQLFQINKFKKGFGGEFIFYPKRMYFILKPFRYRVLSKIKSIYNRLKNRNKHF